MTQHPPNVKAERGADGAQKATIEIYALSLVAMREDGGRLAFEQEASWTYASSDADAHTEGISQAQEKWPQTEGWEYHVTVRKVTIQLDLLEKES